MAIRIVGSGRGSGMVLAFFVMTIITVLGVSFLAASSQSLMVAKREALRARAIACAEAGVDRAIAFLMEGGPNGETPGDWRTVHPSSHADNHTNDVMYQATLAAGESYRVCVRDGFAGTLNEGKIVITSEGTAAQAGLTTTETITAVVNLNRENINVWSNVIFGGVGQAGRSINGNVAIRGSVHLLGDGEPFTDIDGDGRWDDNEPYTDSNGNGQYDFGEPFTDVDGDGRRDAREPFIDANGNGIRDPALTVTDMASEISGNADMGNNYDGMPAELRALLPALPREVFGGELVDTLKAKLRVKHGRVNISGTASVGFSDVTGNSVKETVDGVYVSDGFGGTRGTGGVFSDNGHSNGYDLGDGVVTMPLITQGAYTDAGGTTHANYLQYLQANATVYTGDVTVRKGTAMTISGPKGTLSIDASGNMTISGIVYITGNINFQPSKSRIIYQGKGTLVTPQSAFVHCDLLPKTRFPTTDALGLVCGDRIELATGGGDAQLTMAIAMYAQHRVVSNKQSQIAGTIVSSYFQMSNVPKIYQAPDLADNLPPGMPGADPIWIISLDVESWM